MRSLISICLCVFLSPGVARATGANEGETNDLTELSLEALMEIEIPTVYGASKYEQRTTDAPSSVSVVTADEIKRYGHRTLADVLQSVQGFHVSYDRNYSFLGVRGVNLGDFNSRVLLLVDGHRVNNNLTDGAYIGTAFPLDVDLIDRVEIIRGPGSVLYGNNAFFGVINVITRNGTQLKGAELSGEYARFDTYKGRVTYGNSFSNGVDFLLSGTLYDSAGPDKLFFEEFNTPTLNNGVANGLDDESLHSLFGSISYRDFTLESAYIDREKGNPTAQFVFTNGFNDPRLRTEDKRGYVSLDFEHSYPDVVDVTARLYYDWNSYRIGYPLVFNIGTNIVDVSSFEKAEGEWWGAELQLNKRLWDRHVVTLGAEYRDDFRQERSPSGQQRSPQSHGIFGQGDFAVLTNLHLIGGIRYDHYEEVDPAYSPRLALIYSPVKQSTLKFIYGTAFRAPNFLELSDLLQDPKPEEITTYEAVYEQGIGDHMRSSVSAFFNRMDDLIVFESGGFTNLNAESKGVELALQGRWAHQLRGRLSYTLQHTRNRSFARDLADSPEHLIKCNLSVPLYEERIFAGLEFQYVSRRDTLFTTTSGTTVSGGTADGYGVLNFTLFTQDLIRNLEASASVYNILDQEYEVPSSRFHLQDTLDQDGIGFRLKLAYRF